MQALLRLAIIDRSGHRLEWRCSLPPPPACGCHRCCRANRCDPPLQPSNQRLIVTSLIFIPPLPPGSAPMRRRSPSRFHYRTLSPCPCPPHQPSITPSVDCYFLLAITHATSLSTSALSSSSSSSASSASSSAAMVRPCDFVAPLSLQHRHRRRHCYADYRTINRRRRCFTLHPSAPPPDAIDRCRYCLPPSPSHVFFVDHLPVPRCLFKAQIHLPRQFYDASTIAD